MISESIAVAPFTQLQGDLVSLQGGMLKPYDASNLTKVDYFAVYFSAHWCPPCRRFTPELVKFYKEAKAKNPNFEIIFVSADNSENDMRKYMEETGMTWPAVKYSMARNNPLNQYAQRGIPNLVFADKTGKVLSASYQNGQFVGPYKVLEDIKKTLK